MFVGPFDSRYRVVGIDPGTDTLGVSLIEVDLRTSELILLDSVTYRGQLLARSDPLRIEKHGDRFARLMGHRSNLLYYFQQAQPHAFACEAPYMGRFPQAYAALTECVLVIKQAVELYDPFKKLYLYDPPTVKKSVSVNGKSGDKEAMRRAISQLRDLQNPSGISFAVLDEHSIDSIAVSYCRAKELLNSI